MDLIKIYMFRLCGFVFGLASSVIKFLFNFAMLLFGCVVIIFSLYLIFINGEFLFDISMAEAIYLLCLVVVFYCLFDLGSGFKEAVSIFGFAFTAVGKNVLYLILLVSVAGNIYARVSDNSNWLEDFVFRGNLGEFAFFFAVVSGAVKILALQYENSMQQGGIKMDSSKENANIEPQEGVNNAN